MSDHNVNAILNVQDPEQHCPDHLHLGRHPPILNASPITLVAVVVLDAESDFAIGGAVKYNRGARGSEITPVQ